MSGTTLEDIYGRGFAFPFHVDSAGGIATQGSETAEQSLELVSQAIRQIVLCSLGTRSMLRGFGGSLKDLVFATKNEADRNILAHRLAGQIALWDRRVRQPIKVSILDRVGTKRIDISVSFRLISEQVEGNVVVPVALGDDGQLRLGPTSEWSKVSAVA